MRKTTGAGVGFSCQFCGRKIQWLATKFGRRMLFDVELVPAAEQGEPGGWIPGNWRCGRSDRVVLAPIDHYSRSAREHVAVVAMLHQCPQYRQAKALGLLDIGGA